MAVGSLERADAPLLGLIIPRPGGHEGRKVVIMEQKKASPDYVAMLLESFSKEADLPALRTRIEAEMAYCPYQVMAIYQRSRHNRQKGEYWPDKPESAPAVSRYPNILAELNASGMWIDRIAGYAQVSMEIMAAAMEDNGELSFMEVRGLTRCFGCKMEYLSSPALSMVDPTTNKGKVRLKHLKDLEQRTRGMERFFYHIHSEDVLPKLESGKSVTYAAYRWACKNLQDVLDSNAHEELRRQRTRTGDLPVAKARKEVWTDLSTRIQMHRKRDKALKLERRLVEIRKYVDDTRLESASGRSEDLAALAEYSKRDLYGALLLAIVYGQALGYRATKAEV